MPWDIWILSKLQVSLISLIRGQLVLMTYKLSYSCKVGSLPKNTCHILYCGISAFDLIPHAYNLCELQYVVHVDLMKWFSQGVFY